jgi:AAHS family benzoate transporter-like MFS transporter
MVDKSSFNKFFLVNFLITLIIVITDGYEMYMFGLVVPALIKEGQLNVMQAGMLASYGLLGTVFGAIIFGMLADKLGRKVSLITGILIYSVFTGCAAFTTSYAQFAVFRFIAGLGIAGVIPNLVSGISEYSPLKHRALMTSSASLGAPLGNIVAVICGLLVLGNNGWRSMFYIGFVPLVLIPVVYYFLPESIVHTLKKGDKTTVGKILQKADPKFVPSEDDEYIVHTHSGNKASFKSLFVDGRGLNTILLWVIMFINMFILFGLVVWIPKLMIGQGYDLGSSLLMVGMFAGGAILGMPLIGRLTDLLGYKRILIITNLLAAVFIAIFGTKPDYPVLMTLLFFAGACIQGLTGAQLAYVSANYPLTIRATAVGWIYGMARLGAALGPILGGILLSKKVPFYSNILVFAGAAVICALAVVFTKDNSKVSINYNSQINIQKI